MYTILTINPGSTSTKVAVYKDAKPELELTLRHSAEEIGQFNNIIDQFDFRKQIIVDALEKANINIKDLDAVIGRGGLIKPIKSGVYEVNQTMLDDIRYRSHGQHASNLGALLAYDIAQTAGVKSYIADPVVVDELQDVARVTGLPQIKRNAIFHALNQKAMARRYAEENHKSYEEMNLVVAHLGGGISIGAHRKGEVIDVNNALSGEGPFSPERAGTLPVCEVARLCFDGTFKTFEEFYKLITSRAGYVALLGTNSAIEVEKRALSGEDPQAKLIYEAMAYNVAKMIGAMATVLKGNVDAVIITGGMAYDKNMVAYIRDMVSYISKVVVYPGEDELEALAKNALNVLEGKVTAKIYE